MKLALPLAQLTLTSYEFHSFQMEKPSKMYFNVLSFQVSIKILSYAFILPISLVQAE